MNASIKLSLGIDVERKNKAYKNVSTSEKWKIKRWKHFDLKKLVWFCQGR